MNKLHISVGNNKMGAIPSFSLPAGLTCSPEACKTCFVEGCYARKIERLRPTVHAAYMDNYEYAINDMGKLEWELSKYFELPNSPKLFRVHVSGDFYSREYLEMWLRIMKNNPTTRFLAFTKQAEVIRPCLDKLPTNLSLVWSAWHSTEIPEDIRAKLPIAWVECNEETRIPDTAFRCPNNCATCGKCWKLGDNDVAFHKH